MIEIGDCFKNKNINCIFEVVKFLEYDRIECVVHFEGRWVGKSSEHKNYLKKLEKLTLLEKELI
jgi:hypothetical protein